MTPDRLTAALRALANQIDRSPSPSRSSVAAKLLKMVTSVDLEAGEARVESGREVSPARLSFDVANDAAYDRLLTALRNGMPSL